MLPSPHPASHPALGDFGVASRQPACASAGGLRVARSVFGHGQGHGHVYGSEGRPVSPLDSPLTELYWVSRLILKSQKTQFAGEVRFTGPKARSSVVEHYLDTVGVDGSIPPAPTTYPVVPIAPAAPDALSTSA